MNNVVLHTNHGINHRAILVSPAMTSTKWGLPFMALANAFGCIELLPLQLNVITFLQTLWQKCKKTSSFFTTLRPMHIGMHWISLSTYPFDDDVESFPLIYPVLFSTVNLLRLLPLSTSPFVLSHQKMHSTSTQCHRFPTNIEKSTFTRCPYLLDQLHDGDWDGALALVRWLSNSTDFCICFIS